MKWLIHALVFSVVVNINAQSYTVKNPVKIEFDGGRVDGFFSTLKGEIFFDKKNLSSTKFEVEIPIRFIETGNDLMNKHAKGEDWFDIISFPKAKYKSTNVVKIQHETYAYKLSGSLDLHGIKKSVDILFNFDGTVFKGKCMINRKDFGIKGNMFGFSVADKYDIFINVPVTSKQ